MSTKTLSPEAIKAIEEAVKEVSITPEQAAEIIAASKLAATAADAATAAVAAVKAQAEKAETKEAELAEAARVEAEEKAVATTAAASQAALPKDEKGNVRVNFTKMLYTELIRKRTGNVPKGKSEAEAAEFKFLAEYAQKAMSVATDTAGGFLIPEEWSNEIIPTLKAESVVVESGVNVMTTSRDTLHVPRFNAKKTFAWSAENVAATESNPTTQEVVLTPFKCIGLVAVSTEFLEDADANTDSQLRDELLSAMAEHLDLAFLEGAGTTEPLGLRNNAEAGVNEIIAGANGAAITYDMLVNQEEAMKTDNVRPPYVWVTHPRTVSQLKKLKDADSRPLFMSQSSPNGQFGDVLKPLGYPVFESAQISIAETQGTETAASYILMYKPRNILIAQRRGVTVAVSEHAGFASDQVQIRLTARFDIGLRHPQGLGRTIGLAP